MLIFIQCLILCAVFTLAILPAQYRDPLSQFASYPTAIRKRVYELPEYREYINKTERKNWKRKIAGSVLIAVVLALLAFYSGNRTFQTAFSMFLCYFYQ